MINRHSSGKRFLLAGAAGFVVDASMFGLLTYVFGAFPLTNRALSIAAAISVTFVLSRHFVFHGAKDVALTRSLPRYLLSQSLGLSINYATFGLLIGILNGALGTTIALFGSTALGAMVNYLGARFFAFRETR
ncbi:MAG: GtrA family protein [Pseudomonadota bacterium]